MPRRNCEGRTSRSGGTRWKPTSTTCGPRWPGARAPPPTDEDAEHGLRLAGALWYFWFQRGLPGEGRRWLARALVRVRTAGADRAQALLGAGTLAWRQGDFVAARVHLDESVALWRDTADRRGRAEALHVLGHVEFDQRDYAAAQVLFEDSLAAYRLAADTLGGLPLMADLGLVAYHRGDYVQAGVVFEDSLAQFRRHELKDRVAGALSLLGGPGPARR